MLYLLIAFAILIVCILFIMLSQHLNSKKYIQKLNKSYGEKPLYCKRDFSLIKMMFEENFLHKQKIDDITYSDLELSEVFSRIDYCQTNTGEQYLYANMICLGAVFKLNKQELENKIKKFQNNEELRIKVTKGLCNIGKREAGYYVSSFVNNTQKYRISHGIIYKLLSSLLVLGIVTSIITGLIPILVTTILVYLINIVLYTVQKQKHEHNIDLVSEVSKHIKANKELNKIDDSFDDYKKLKSLRSLLCFMQFKKSLNMAGDIIALFISYCIGAFLIDFLAYNEILTQIEKNKKIITCMIYKHSEEDTMLSIAYYRKSLNKWCVPSFESQSNLVCKELYHPLIDNCVENDIEVSNFSIITGSNASGKSTYIKSIAINFIFGKSINTCTASKMNIGYDNLFTSMALRDDLLQNKSYYIQEIESLKRMIEQINDDNKVLIIIDEILKGTNRKDRLAVSKAVIDYLIGKNCTVIIATHDYEFVNIYSDYNVDFYYFRTMEDDLNLEFDYKIHLGSTQYSNAIKLLEVKDFPKEIIASARNYHDYNLNSFNFKKEALTFKEVKVY